MSYDGLNNILIKFRNLGGTIRNCNKKRLGEIQIKSYRVLDTPVYKLIVKIEQ